MSRGITLINRTFVKHHLSAWFISAVVHAAILVALSFWVLPVGRSETALLEGRWSAEANDEPLITTDATWESAEEPSYDTAFESSLPSELFEGREMSGFDVPLPTDMLPTWGWRDGQLGGSRSAEARGELGLGGRIPQIPVPRSAVKRGSFTVWTIPETPLPQQSYVIVIQVQLPDNLEMYPLSDLTGTVRGTDRYFKAIAFMPHERIPVQDGVARIMIPIPGAKELVRDTIMVRSRLLREQQLIELVFRKQPAHKPGAKRPN